MSKLLSFPDPVNEVAARVVATGVVLMALTTLVLGEPWIIAVMAYGFVARVLTGPKLSPLGLVATRVIVPRLGVEPRWVPGPPKRFAQGVGVAFTVTALVFAFALDEPTVAYALIAGLLVAASLEAFAGLCLGCKAFALLMRAGVVPQSVCERCAPYPAD